MHRYPGMITTTAVRKVIPSFVSMRIFVALGFMLTVGPPCRAAGQLSPSQFKASPEVSALIAELRSANASNRTHAAKALVAIGPSAARSLGQAMAHWPYEKTESTM